MSGTPIRQDYLETVIRWVSGGGIEEYMAQRQHEPNANDLWLYFQTVVAWVKATFPNYRREMKGLPWGDLYNKHKDDKLDPKKIEEQVARLMADEDVTKKKGVYAYVLTGEEHHLNIRQFSDKDKREAYERQKDVCPICGSQYDIGEMEADHITPWHEGGETRPENCQMLCREDNRRIGGARPGYGGEPFSETAGCMPRWDSHLRGTNGSELIPRPSPT